MQDFKIRVKSIDADDIDTYSIWGEIYVEINGKSLPDNAWYDSASSIIHMWLSETIEQLSGKQDCWELPFMDGPYKICLNKDTDTNTLVRFLVNDKEILGHTVVDTENIIQEILDCAETFMNLCYRDAPSSTSMRTFIEIQKMYNILKERST